MEQVPREATDISEVWVTSGTGTGRSQLTAFDAALADAGLHNANLVSVSSITPAKASRHTADDPADLAKRITPGAVVPVVYAHAESRERDKAPYAAVAGVRLADGYGINVEAHGTDGDREEVTDQCESMLAEMARTRGDAFDSSMWVRYESANPPEEEDTWRSAVAALVYQ